MPTDASRVGTLAWSKRTNGQLSSTERRQLLAPLARAHVHNLVGRTAMALHVNSGRRAAAPCRPSAVPSSALTRAAEEQARQRLSPVLLAHSYRCYRFGIALAAVEHIDVDRELLFAAAMLHDTGLATPRAGVDFTLASARVARDVADAVGLSTAATEALRSAITMHHSPDVTRADGPVAFLMSAGAAIDVTGFRAWQLPPHVVPAAVADHPRAGFTHEFRTAWAAEAAAVPQGRARFLRRYGAFDLAIRLAPYEG